VDEKRSENPGNPDGNSLYMSTAAEEVDVTEAKWVADFAMIRGIVFVGWRVLEDVVAADGMRSVALTPGIRMALSE